jgi:hypothetical protein
MFSVGLKPGERDSKVAAGKTNGRAGTNRGSSALTVHFDEELVERVLSFVVVAGFGASPSDSVDLVDEDDAGCILPGRSKEIANARGADADEHFNEV